MHQIVYDTNALFHPAKLRRLAGRPGVTMWGCVTQVLETVSDIVDEKSFREARSQLGLMLEVSPTHFLPSADEQFRMALGVLSEPSEAPARIRIAETVAKAETLSELDLNLELAREMREKHDHAFLGGLFSTMIPSIKPMANIQPERFNIQLRGRELKEFETFLFSEEGRRALTESWLRRQDWDRMVLPTRIVAEAHRVLRGYYLAYRGYAINLFERNLKPRANDALDLDLTFTLDLPNCTLVTGDRRLLDAMTRGGMPPSRYANIHTLDPERFGDFPSAY